MKDKIAKIINSTKVVIFSRDNCGYCSAAKQIISSINPPIQWKEVNMSREDDGQDMEDALYELTNQYTVPNIFINGNHIGGCDELKKLQRKGELMALLTQ